ncbi:MAG: efflux RND transporter periplasmic adaptor subunit [Gemmatimonadales bacterium]|nr:MAG: efflux RND transporter periplasmic adaptor subunit [Gemmatimonadales bacterium]
MVTRGLVVGLAVVAAWGCGDGQAEDGGFGGGGFAAPVEVARVQVDTVVDAIQATGQIEAVQSIMLRPDIEGRITGILFREGGYVRAGTPLFKVDDAELVAQVARAEAERDLSRQALERTRTLIAQNAASQADLEQAEATSRSSEAQYELLKVRLDRTVVRAPFGGVAGSRQVSLGDYVTSSTGLVTLQTVHPQRAAFQVPERYASELAIGQDVTFRVAAIPGRDFQGTVEFVDPIVTLPARTILVKARVPNRGRELQPGMFIEVRLATDVRPAAMIVPEEAIVPREAGPVIWVIDDSSKAERRAVELGVRTPGFVEIRSGVAAGEQVVVGGQVRLQPGMPVTPIPVDRQQVVPADTAAAEAGPESPPPAGAASENSSPASP